VALVMGLLATLTGWFFLRENERRLESAYHEAAADRLLQQVNERLGKVDLILRSVAGLFSAQNLVERREFENYVAGLRPIDALPEVVGIGFMRRVETARVGAVEALLSAAYEREVKVLPAPDPARAVFVFPVSYIWPQSPRTLVSIGYDGYGDALRRPAMDEALRSDRPAMTGPSGSRRGTPVRPSSASCCTARRCWSKRAARRRHPTAWSGSASSCRRCSTP
jgi:CHASE1-domain containing sensor protein